MSMRHLKSPAANPNFAETLLAVTPYLLMSPAAQSVGQSQPHRGKRIRHREFVKREED
jgi:hypothetical protein